MSKWTADPDWTMPSEIGRQQSEWEQGIGREARIRNPNFAQEDGGGHSHDRRHTGEQEQGGDRNSTRCLQQGDPPLQKNQGGAGNGEHRQERPHGYYHMVPTSLAQFAEDKIALIIESETGQDLNTLLGD